MHICKSALYVVGVFVKRMCGYGGAGVIVLVCMQGDGLGVFQQTHMFLNTIYLPRVDCFRMAAAFHLSI